MLQLNWTAHTVQETLHSLAVDQAASSSSEAPDLRETLMRPEFVVSAAQGVNRVGASHSLFGSVTGRVQGAE